MGFSADAIGFYLQAEDQLTPALSDAASAYRKFVKQLEQWNRQAYKSASSGLGQIADLFEAFDDLPQRAVRSYKDALGAMRTRVKAVTQPINVVFTAQSRRSIAKAVSDAVARSLSGARLRLQASFPKTRLGMFDTSASLRSQYTNMVQPPDLKGRFEPRRFKKGGLVDGGTPGKDSVLSLLQPGEFVLPKDVVQRLGRQRGPGGRFEADPAKPFLESIARIETMGKALDKLKVSLDAGLGDPTMIKMFERGLRSMNDEISTFVKNSSSLTYQQQVRLAPAIKEVRNQVDNLSEATKEAGTLTELLLGKILGPARWIAIATAGERVVEGLRNLKDAGVQGLESLGGDQVESFTTNMNQLNTRLNLTRAELGLFKDEAADLADLHDLNINEMSEAIEGLAVAGVRTKEEFFRLAPTVTNFSKAAGVAFDTSAAAAYRLGDAYGFTADQVALVFDDIRRSQTTFNADAGRVTEDTIATLQTLGPALLDMSEEARIQTVRSLSGLAAAMQSTWGDASQEVMTLIGRAATGETDAMQSVGLIFGKTIDEVLAQMQGGDLTGLFDSLGRQVQSLEGNTPGLNALKEALHFEGTNEQFVMLGRNTKDLNEAFKQFREGQIPIENSSAAVDSLGVAARSTRRHIDELRTEFGQLAGKEIPVLGFSLGDVIDGIDDLGVTTLAATGMLIKMGVDGAYAAYKGLGSLVPMLGNVFKGMRLFGGATKAATVASTTASAAGSAAAGGGLFAGLSAGLTALAGGVATLGAVLLSPPGIAFTVSLVAVLLALGGALGLASPALKVFGDIAVSAFGKVVEVVGLLAPVLTTLVTTIGTTLSTALQSIVQVFQALFQADPTRLMAVGPALLGVAAGLSAVALASAAIAAVNVGQSILGFFADDPAETAAGVFALLASMIGSVKNLKVATPEALAALTGTVNGLGGFAVAYGRLVSTLGQLPEGEELGPRFKSLAGAFGEASRVSELRQATTSTAVVPSQLQAVVDAIRNNPVMDDICAATERTNALLAKILDALAGGKTRDSATAPPQRVQGPSSLGTTSQLTRDVAGFGH